MDQLRAMRVYARVVVMRLAAELEHHLGVRVYPVAVAGRRRASGHRCVRGAQRATREQSPRIAGQRKAA